MASNIAASKMVIKVDYLKAIQNLTDILIDHDKFNEMVRNIYDAIDTDSSGTLTVEQVEVFVRAFLKGNQIEGQINTSFEDKHEDVFLILKENEAGVVTNEELGKFMKELLKNQVKELQKRVEQNKYARSLDLQPKAETETPKVEETEK